MRLPVGVGVVMALLLALMPPVASAEGSGPPTPRVMARPDTDTDVDDAYTAPQSARHHYDSRHFRLHWTSQTEDAATIPFVKQAARVFEQVWRDQIDRLGWPAPPSDGGLGGNDLVDVYLVDLGREAYGYATVDASAVCGACQSVHGYLVLDNDYVGFGPDPTVALESTAAHEFSHLVQFGIAYGGEGWAYESTAVWLERAVFPSSDARTQYLRDFADRPELPLSDFGQATGGFDRSYGAYVWNVWLAHRFGPSVIRDAWLAAGAADGHVLQGYADVLARRGSRLEHELVAFLAATAAWDVGGFPGEPARYPVLARAGSLTPGSVQTIRVDHTAAYVADITGGVGDAGRLTVTVRGPKFVAGGIALVASGTSPDGGGVVTVIDDTLFDGEATVTLEAHTASRITLVVVNADAGLAVPKPPGSDRPRYLFDDVEYLLGIDVDPGPRRKP